MSMSPDQPTPGPPELLGAHLQAPIASMGTAAAARTLGVRPNTLRAWEQQYAFPQARLDIAGRRQFRGAEISALRDTLNRSQSIQGAILAARRSTLR